MDGAENITIDGPKRAGPTHPKRSHRALYLCTEDERAPASVASTPVPLVTPVTLALPMASRCACVLLTLTLLACGSTTRAEPVDAPRVAEVPPAPVDAGARVEAIPADGGTSDAAAAPSAPIPPAPKATEPPRVKIVTIGMHVAGGPFDEPTKEPFKKAVEPHFPELAECWAKHVTKPPKQADVGVDLLIEAAGGRPAVSNPRANFDKGVADGFVPCVIGVFESVEFPRLVGRGRTGVSYSLRFTRQ